MKKNIFVVLLLLLTLVSKLYGQDVNFNAINRDLAGLGNRNLVAASPRSHLLNSAINEGRGLQVNGLNTFDVQDIAIADFNSDGMADIATISSEPFNNSKGTISLFLATGDGNFSLPQTFPTTNKPFVLTAIDGDNDGLIDLAVVENGLVEIFSGFLLNTGLITPRDRLGDPNNNPSGNGLLISAGTPISTAFIKLNADSISDLVVVSATATESLAQCDIFLSDNGNLTTKPVMLKTVGSVEVGAGSQKTLAIAAANLPDPQTAKVDKDLDIFIATSLGIEIFENTTTNFVAQPILTLSSKVSQVIAGDLNSDSKTDILALDKTSGVVFDILAFNDGYAVPITVQSRPNAITFALFNSNTSSLLSMAILTSSSSQSSQNSIVVLSANRFGIFQFSNILPSDPTISINNPSVLAIGRPGRVPALPPPATPSAGGDDILIGQHAIGINKGGLLLLSNRLNYQAPILPVITNMQSIDFDGAGGVNDLLIVEQNLGQVYLVLNNFGQVMPIVVRDLFTSGRQLITSATIFRDPITGVNNLAISLISNPGLATASGQIITGTMTGFGDTNSMPRFRQFVASQGITNLMAGDFNNDAFDDLAYIDPINNSIAITLNNGRGLFVDTTIRETGGFIPVAATLFDANDDDFLDIAVVNQGAGTQGNQSLVSILFGNGKGQFQITGNLLQVPNFALSVVGGLESLSTNNGMRQVVDFNQDGFADLAIVSTGVASLGGNDAASLTLLLNRPDNPGQFVVQPPIPLRDEGANTSLQLLAKLGGAAIVSGRFGDSSVNSGLGFGGANQTLAVGDFNSDGNQDIVVGGTRLVNNLNFRSAIYLIGNATGGLARIVRPQRTMEYLGTDPNLMAGDTFVSSATVNFSGLTLPPDAVHISVNGRVWVDNNRPPIINRAPNITIQREDLNAPTGMGIKEIVTIGQILTIPISGFDADNDPLTFRLVATPTGQQPPEFVTIQNLNQTSAQLTIDTSNLTKTPNVLTNRIVVEVSDAMSNGNGGRQPLTARAYFTLIIRPNSAPTIAPIANQTLSIGQTTTVNVKVSNNEGKQILLAASCDKGNFVRLMQNALTITPQASDVGTNSCKVTATDEFGLSNSTSFTVIVLASTPSITPIPDQEIKAGEPKVIRIMANDPGGSNGLKFSVSSGPSFVTLIDNGNATATLLIAPPINQSQGGRVTIEVTNSFGQKANTSFNILLAKSVVITVANYTKPTLFVAGNGFQGTNIIIQVNGKDVASFIVNRVDTAITLKGTRKKLNLKSGNNQINIILDGVVSNSFNFAVR